MIALVHNDSTYGAIKNIQDRSSRGDISTSSSITPISSSWRMPMAFLPSVRPRPKALDRALREALDRDGPSLIEVPDQWRYLRDVANPVPGVQ